jgi:hypothetical protein
VSATTRHIESDPLAAIRADLMSAAARRQAGRRRTRRAAVIAATLVGLLAAAAATAAIGGFSTGVPVVDELVGIESGGTGPTGQRLADRRPGPGPGTEPLAVPIGDGVYQTVAYLSRDGDICVASAERHRGGVRGTSGGCPSVEDVNRRVERLGADWHGSAIGLDQRVNNFLVAGDVENVRPLGEGDWSVLMTPPWTPKAEGGRPLRLAVVIDDADIGNPDDGFQEDEMRQFGSELHRMPSLELTYGDGSKRVFRDPYAK